MLMFMAGQLQARLEWTEPGHAPYAESDERALEILARKILIPHSYERIPSQVLDRQFELWHASGCTQREIQPNEYFGYMLFGRGQVEHDVHARTEAWKTGIPFGITECIVVDRERGLICKLQRPDVCHNWAYTIARLPPPPATEGSSEPPPKAAPPGGGEKFGSGGGSGSHASTAVSSPRALLDGLGGIETYGPFAPSEILPPIFPQSSRYCQVPNQS